MIDALYFRGLSTSGTDVIRWSGIPLGTYTKPMERAMLTRGVRLHPVPGMGRGSLSEVTARAWAFVKDHPLFSSGTPLHLIGHSAGGIVARGIDGLAPTRFSTLTTIATAHRGSSLAEICADFPEKFPRTERLLTMLALDVGEKREFLIAFTPAAVAEHLRGLIPGGAVKASVVCVAPRAEWSLPLRLLHRLGPLRTLNFVGDGLVDESSQSFGEVLGLVRADHIQQIGLFRNPRAVQEICDLVAAFEKREASSLTCVGEAPYPR